MTDTTIACRKAQTQPNAMTLERLGSQSEQSLESPRELAEHLHRDDASPRPAPKPEPAKEPTDDDKNS
jgi:hypothetical protein